MTAGGLRRRSRALYALSARAPALAAACALTASAAFSVALAIAFFARPTRAYVFPLVADIDARHPESAILRAGTALATLLLAATAAGAVGAVVPATLVQSPASQEEPVVGSEQEPGRRLRARKLALWALLLAGTAALLAVQARGAAYVLDSDAFTALESVRGTVGEALVSVVAASWLVMLLFLIWFFLRLQATAVDYSVLEPVSGTQVSSEQGRDHAGGVEKDSLALSSSGFSSITASGSASSVGPGFLAASASGQSSLGGGSAATCPGIPADASSTSTKGIRMMSSLAYIPIALSSSVASLQSMREMDGPELRAFVVPRLRAVGWRIVAMFRPVCLTAQVVSAIKIAGLMFALNTFSISKIRLIRTALLAALAFAQYTAVFFVAFFLLILSIDMRRASEDERWRLRLKLAPASSGPRVLGSV